MTQDERIDKAFEIAARIASFFVIADADNENSPDCLNKVGKISIGIAKAIISEAEKEDMK